MYRYAQINMETGRVVSDSRLSGEVDQPNMISIPDDFDPMGKMYVNGEWVTLEPTEQEAIST